LVERYGPQPGPKAAVPVVGKGRQGLHERDENVLNQIGGIGFRKADPACPRKQQGSVELDETIPRTRLPRLTKPLEQADGRRQHGGISRDGLNQDQCQHNPDR
jgi:hypothetical protein